MKKNRIRICEVLIISLAVFVLVACDTFTTRQDIKKKEDEKQLREQVSAIQKSKADNDLKYSDIENDIKVIAGRVDTIDHAQQSSQSSTRQEIESLKRTIEAQNEKIKLLEQHLEASSSGVVANSAPVTSHSSGKENKNSDAYEEAESLLESKEFKKAIVKYQAFRDKNPKAPKASDATYKIGVCFSELGMKKDAKEFYLETIDSYPGTKAAKKAKYRLSKLK